MRTKPPVCETNTLPCCSPRRPRCTTTVTVTKHVWTREYTTCATSSTTSSTKSGSLKLMRVIEIVCMFSWRANRRAQTVAASSIWMRTSPPKTVLLWLRLDGKNARRSSIRVAAIGSRSKTSSRSSSGSTTAPASANCSRSSSAASFWDISRCKASRVSRNVRTSTEFA
eukprot:Amastigsp_a174680_152.p3 type:complete len:169 gc:universal Amastigsp_a174680_152:286-792(+)